MNLRIYPQCHSIRNYKKIYYISKKKLKKHPTLPILWNHVCYMRLSSHTHNSSLSSFSMLSLCLSHLFLSLSFSTPFSSLSLLLLSENTQLQKDLHNINEVSLFPDVHIVLLYLQMEDKIKKELETLKENISTMQQVGEMYQIILYYIVYCYRRLKCSVT